LLLRINVKYVEEVGGREAGEQGREIHGREAEARRYFRRGL
jgi:hypothetical protein